MSQQIVNLLATVLLIIAFAMLSQRRVVTLVNLLVATEAPGLVAPASVASPDAGVRFQLTLGVDDVDATCDELRRRGVELLNGPLDRPWGIRTASFRDPGGHVWEIAR